MRVIEKGSDGKKEKNTKQRKTVTHVSSRKSFEEVNVVWKEFLLKNIRYKI